MDELIKSSVFWFFFGKMGVGKHGKIKECEKGCLSGLQGSKGVINGCEGTPSTPKKEMEELKRGPENSGRAE